MVPKAHSLFFYTHFLKCHLLSEVFFVVFSRSVISNTLQPCGLQHARLLCLSLSPRPCSNSCPLSQWHQLSSVVPFSSCLQSFLTSGSFPMSQLFASDGQSIRASASVSALPMNIQDWFHLKWTCWISLQSKGLSRIFSNTTVQNSSALSLLYRPALISIREYYMYACEMVKSFLNHPQTRNTHTKKETTILALRNTLSQFILSSLCFSTSILYFSEILCILLGIWSLHQNAGSRRGEASVFFIHCPVLNA